MKTMGLASKKVIHVAFSLAGMVLPGSALGGPRAEISTTSWQLDVEFFDPQRITVRSPITGKETTYWYTLYQVTNRTGRDVDFLPSFRLVTDTLKVVEAAADVPPYVYDAIAARHKKQYPYFLPPGKVIGPLLQGEENARVSAAVFTTFDPTASSFTIYMSGFSGYIEQMPNPAFDPSQPESDDNPRSFLLRRTLAVTYQLPGDPQTRGQATPIRRSREWVNR